MIVARLQRRLSRYRVVLAGGLVALAVGLALTLLALFERQAHVERTSDHTVLMARVFADQATRSIDATAMALANLKNLLARGQAPDAPELRASLAQALVNLPFLRGIGIVDSQGRVLASGDLSDVGTVIDLSRLGPVPRPGQWGLGRVVAERRLADLRLGAPLRFGRNRGELALVVQNVGLPYQDFDKRFLFQRRAFVTLQLEN